MVLGVLVVAFICFFLYSFGFEYPFHTTIFGTFLLAYYATRAQKELEKRKLLQSLLQNYENEVE